MLQNPIRRSFVLLVFALTTLCCKQESCERFTRVKKNLDGSESVQTGIARFIIGYRDSARIVTLVASIHKGEKAYYDSIQKVLDSTDAVLYEDLARGDEKYATSYRENKSCRELARFKDTYLDAQLEQLSTQALAIQRKGHFIHADLENLDTAPDDVRKRFANPSLAEAECARELAEVRTHLKNKFPGVANDDLADHVLTAFKSHEERELGLDYYKERMHNRSLLNAARTKVKMAAVSKQRLPPEWNDWMAARDDIVIRKLRPLLDDKSESAPKSIAIFYGASHMPNISKRLVAEFDAAPGDFEWVTAFNVIPMP